MALDWDDFIGSALGGCLWSSIASDCATTIAGAAPLMATILSGGEIDLVGDGLEPVTPAESAPVVHQWIRSGDHGK
jgi:hypothetical protein